MTGSPNGKKEDEHFHFCRAIVRINCDTTPKSQNIVWHIPGIQFMLSWFLFQTHDYAAFKKNVIHKNKAGSITYPGFLKRKTNTIYMESRKVVQMNLTAGQE